MNLINEFDEIIDDYAVFNDTDIVTDSIDLFTYRVDCYYTLQQGDGYISIATRILYDPPKIVLFYKKQNTKIYIKPQNVTLPPFEESENKQVRIKNLSNALMLLNGGKMLKLGDTIKIGTVSFENNATEDKVTGSNDDLRENSNPRPNQQRLEKETKQKQEVKQKQEEKTNKIVVDIIKSRLTAIGENKTGKDYDGNPSVPKPTSGVTIGFGYDVSQRDKNSIKENLKEVFDITNSGDLKKIQLMQNASGLRGPEAKKYIIDNMSEYKPFITEEKALILLNQQLIVYELGPIGAKEKMTTYHKNYNYEPELEYSMLTFDIWDDLYATVKVLIVDLHYHGMLAGPGVFLKEENSGDKQTLVKALCDAIAPIYSGNKRKLRTELEIFKELKDIFAFEGIGFQIMKEAKKTLYYKGPAFVKPLEDKIPFSCTFTGNPSDIVSCNSHVQRRASLRSAYIDFIITQLTKGNIVRII